MEGSIKFILLLLLLLHFTPPNLASAVSPTAAQPHRSPRQLANIALADSAKRARDASAYFSNSSSARPAASGGSDEGKFGDCAVAMADSARRLQRSVGELSRLGPRGSKGFWLRMSNVQTWVSAALTDQEACLSSLGRSGAGAAVRKKVLGVRKVTSTALALVNRIGS